MRRPETTRPPPPRLRGPRIISSVKKLLPVGLALSLLAARQPAFAQDTADAPAPFLVRVNFKSTESARAIIHEMRSGKQICTTPCTAEVMVGTRLRVAFEGHEDEPHEFTVSGTQGMQADLLIDRGGGGGRAGGIVMTSVGGAGVFFGFLATVLADKSADPDLFRSIGIASMVGGAAVAGLGILFIVNRTHEPAVDERRAKDIVRRSEILRSDMVAAGARDTFALPAPQQVGWTFRF